jgi:hypothetical protein
MFQPGQLVICIDARDGLRPHGPVRSFKVPLVVGRIYTVTKVFMRKLPSRYGLHHGVFLAEVTPPAGRGFAVPRFRPLDDDRIEVFRRIARAVRIHEEV